MARQGVALKEISKHLGLPKGKSASSSIWMKKERGCPVLTGGRTSEKTACVSIGLRTPTV